MNFQLALPSKTIAIFLQLVPRFIYLSFYTINPEFVVSKCRRHLPDNRLPYFGILKYIWDQFWQFKLTPWCPYILNSLSLNLRILKLSKLLSPAIPEMDKSLLLSSDIGIPEHIPRCLRNHLIFSKQMWLFRTLFLMFRCPPGRGRKGFLKFWSVPKVRVFGDSHNL